MKISEREHVLLSRAHREGGIAEVCSDAERAIVRRLSEKGAVELARGFGVFSRNYAITPSGRAALGVR